MLSMLQSITRWAWRNLPEDTDPEALTAAQAKVVAMAEKFPPLHRFSPAFVRRAYRHIERPFNVDRQSMATVSNRSIPLSDGEQCPLRIYYPNSLPAAGPYPAMVYFHGGGCVMGDLETHDIFCRHVAHEAGLVVIAVDYRCAPEYRFPIPLTDSLEAWNWVVAHADALQLDTSKLGVGGDSAGGYMAVQVCQQTLASTVDVKPQQMPHYQWLIYPMMDIRGGSQSYQQADAGMLLTRAMMDYFSERYIRNQDDMSLSAVNPILTKQLVGLPPTYLISVGHDPLRDDDILYAQRLAEQGIDLQHQHYPNMMHGFISMGGVCQHARRALAEGIDYLKQRV